MAYTFTDIADRLSDLYVSYRGRYAMSVAGGRMFIPKGKDGYSKLTRAIMLGHVHENYALCVFAGEKTSKFMSLDVDLRDINLIDTLVRLMVEVGIPRENIYVSTSGRKGHHIDIFFTGLVYTTTCQKLYKWLIWKSGLSPRKVEFRPTSKQGIKLPLSVHGETGNVCWYLDDEYNPIQDKGYVFQIKPLDRDIFSSIVKKLEEPQVEIQVKERNTSAIDISSDALPQMTEKGTRHKLMLVIAMFYRQEGSDAETTKQILISWYEQQDQRLISSPIEVVLQDIEQIINWVYDASFEYIPHKERSDKALITSKDMAVMMSLHTKGERKVWFYINTWCKRFGQCKATAKRIADMTGMTTRNVFNVLEKLLCSGYIAKEQGEVHLLETGYVAESNTYRIAGVRIPETTEYLLKEALTENVTVDPFELDHHFNTIYSTVCKSFFTEKLLRTLTTKSELE